VVKEAQISAHEVGKEALLDIGHQALPNKAHGDKVAVIRGCPNQPDTKHRQRDNEQHVTVFLNENMIQRRLHHPCVGGGCGRHDQHAQHCKQHLGAVRAQMFFQQAADQREAFGGLCHAPATVMRGMKRVGALVA